MPRYSPERKAALLKKLLPPLNLSVAEVTRQEGISEVTLYAWRKQVKAEGAIVPGDKKLPDDWPAEAKFAVVLEAATLSEIELSEYCRRKGLYPEQVNAWRQDCINGQLSAQTQRQAERVQARGQARPEIGSRSKRSCSIRIGSNRSRKKRHKNTVDATTTLQNADL